MSRRKTMEGGIVVKSFSLGLREIETIYTAERVLTARGECHSISGALRWILDDWAKRNRELLTSPSAGAVVGSVVDTAV